MAVTKIKAIKSTLGKAIAYIKNPDKTDSGVLVSTYNCSADNVALDFAMTATAAQHGKKDSVAGKQKENLAYHLMQSFSPNDNVTPEQAHEIGRQLADRFLKGEYEYVITTHVDKNHIHNHIIINAISWLTGHKLRTRPFKTAQQLRAISDQLCIAHELSVIQKPGKLARSYTEWSSRKKGNSWKADIRKRLNFVLARAISYEQFLAMCGELNLSVDDSGKHIKYRMRGMERWARGNKLADTEHFTKAGIEAQVAENAQAQKTIWAGIREEIGQSSDWDDFLRRLETNHGIRITQGKTGLVYRTQDGIRKKESELGTSFQQEQLLHALRDRSYFPGDAPTPSIREQWEQSQSQIQKDVEYIPLELSESDIDRISLDGLLLRLSTQDGEQSFFVDSDHIDFDPERKIYTAYIASEFYYYALPQDCNPDLPESEQLGTVSLRGEDVIRSLDRSHHVEGQWVEVSPKCIRSITAKGVSLTFPEENIKSVFLAAEDVRLDAKTCLVCLHDNWSYARDLKGRELRSLLEQRPVSVSDSLWRRYRAYERRHDHQSTRSLSKTLRLMEREGIDRMGDFALRRQALRGEQAATQNNIRLIQQKRRQYAMALKHLLTIQQYEVIHEQVADAKGFVRHRLEQRYQQELSAYHSAAAQLKSMNVLLSVDPEKVQGLIGKLEEELRQYRKEAQEIERHIEELDEAEQTVRKVMQTEKSERRDEKNKGQKQEAR